MPVSDLLILGDEGVINKYLTPTAAVTLATGNEQTGKVLGPTATPVATFTRSLVKIFPAALMVGLATVLKQVGQVLNLLGYGESDYGEPGYGQGYGVVTLASISSAIGHTTSTALSCSVTTLAGLVKQVGKVLNLRGYGSGGYGSPPYGDGAGVLLVPTIVATFIQGGFAITLNATVATSAFLTKQVGKLSNPFASISALKSVSVGAVRSAIAVVTPSHLQGVGHQFSASCTAGASVFKQVGKIFTTSVTVLATVTSQIVISTIFDLTTSVGTVASLFKSAGKLEVSSAGTAITRSFSVGAQRAASIVANPSHLSGVGHACSTAMSAGIGVVKDVGKPLGASVVTLASLVAHLTVSTLLTLTCSVTAVASWTRRVVANPVICATLTLTAKACDVLGLSTLSDTLLTLAAKTDDTVTAAAAADGSVTATPQGDA